MHQRKRAASRTIADFAVLAVSVLGLLAFAYPFLLSAVPSQFRPEGTRTVEASLLLGAIVAATITVAIAEIARGPGAGSLSRSVALLGILVAIDATLRLVPSFLGASPIFVLIILVGYVFGGRFGFAMGALTLVLSAAITAGVGPWLPFQMLCAGWVGMAAGTLPHGRGLLPVALYAVIAGFAYGALMNLYSWPFVAPGVTEDAGLYWFPGLTLAETIERYATFYLATSAVHDATRAAASLALVLVAGAPIVRLLRRFQTRTTWSTTATA